MAQTEHMYKCYNSLKNSLFFIVAKHQCYEAFCTSVKRAGEPEVRILSLPPFA